MINWLSNWAQGIIVAVIIATIIEIILPQGSIKKYVKVVIGIYILFTIISPIIGKVYGGNIDINNVLDTSKYIEDMEESNNKVAKELDSNNSRTIKDIFVQNLEEDIKSKLKEKEYKVTSLYVNVKDDGNYTIEQIKVSIDKIKKNSNTVENNQISISINEVVISNTISENSSNNKVTEKDKKEIKKYLEDTYGVNSDAILIN